MILSRRRILPAVAALAAGGVASAQPVPPSSQSQGGDDDDPDMVLKLVIFSLGTLKDGNSAIPPSIRTALDELHALKLKLAIVSDQGRGKLDAWRSHVDLPNYFEAFVTADDVAEGRPAPFMLFRAMEGARVNDVREVMAVGDTVLDLEAADNAGVGAAIGVYSGAATESRLRESRNSGVLPSVAALPGLIKTGLPLSHCR